MKFSFLKKRWFWILFVIVALVIGWSIYRGNANKGPFYDTQAVQRGDIHQTVEVTGEIKPNIRIDLAFKGSGRLLQLKTAVGQTVKQGEVLAQLETRDLSFAVAKARANFLTTQANYNKAVAGAALTDIQVSQASVDAAQVSVDTARNNLIQAQAQQDLLVSNARATLLNTSLTAVPSPSNVSASSPTISGAYMGNEGQYKISLMNNGSGLAYMVSGLENGAGAVNSGVPIPLGTHGLYFQFPNVAWYANDSWTIDLPNKAGSTYLTNLNAYQAAQQTRTQTVASAQDAVKAAQAALEQAQAALAQKQAPSRPEDVASLRAQMLAAEVAYDQTVAQLSDAQIVAPTEGVVSDVIPSVGEQITSGVKEMSLVITGTSTAQVTIPEADIPKIKVGQSVTMTLDAFGDQKKFSGRVLSIEPDQTKIQDAVYYKADLTLDAGEATVKPGMTVNATILTGEQKDTLFIPSRAIQIRDGQMFVRVLAGTQVAEKQIEIGLRGDDGLAEVRSGLSQGDLVIVGELTAQEYAARNVKK